MELKEFIKAVVGDIVAAVDESSDASSRRMALVQTQESRTIEFDIAVTAESAKSKGGKGGVKVLELIYADGHLSEETKNSTVSRIRFGVFVDHKTKKEVEDRAQSRALQPRARRGGFVSGNLD